MKKQAVLVMTFLVASGAASVTLAQRPKPSPTPAPAACTPAANKLEFTAAQADMVMSSFCKNITPANIAGMTGVTEVNVERIACANRPWPAGVQQITCP